MADSKELTERQETAPEARAGTAPTQVVLVPAVDVLEDPDGLTVVADMPGVSADRLDLRVEKDQLVIEGDLAVDVPAEMEPLYAEVRGSHYRRAFSLSQELDTDAIGAEMKDGVLRVRIPKKEAHRPRKIQVQVG
ncbi:MAG TPA: Hsp20/alpha crystallin family protein [Chromatiales bacterium]|nr:Hsp20/alpha crystallin family protein [Chromatiales bacterium]